MLTSTHAERSGSICTDSHRQIAIVTNAIKDASRSSAVRIHPGWGWSSQCTLRTIPSVWAFGFPNQRPPPPTARRASQHQTETDREPLRNLASPQLWGYPASPNRLILTARTTPAGLAAGASRSPGDCPRLYLSSRPYQWQPLAAYPPSLMYLARRAINKQNTMLNGVTELARAHPLMVDALGVTATHLTLGIPLRPRQKNGHGPWHFFCKGANVRTTPPMRDIPASAVLNAPKEGVKKQYSANHPANHHYESLATINIAHHQSHRPLVAIHAHPAPFNRRSQYLHRTPTAPRRTRSF